MGFKLGRICVCVLLLFLLCAMGGHSLLSPVWRVLYFVHNIQPTIHTTNTTNTTNHRGAAGASSYLELLTASRATVVDEKEEKDAGAAYRLSAQQATPTRTLNLPNYRLRRGLPIQEE
jgi:hypothetical protein